MGGGKHRRRRRRNNVRARTNPRSRKRHAVKCRHFKPQRHENKIKTEFKQKSSINRLTIRWLLCKYKLHGHDTNRDLGLQSNFCVSTVQRSCGIFPGKFPAFFKLFVLPLCWALLVGQRWWLRKCEMWRDLLVLVNAIRLICLWRSLKSKQLRVAIAKRFARENGTGLVLSLKYD